VSLLLQQLEVIHMSSHEIFEAWMPGHLLADELDPKLDAPFGELLDFDRASNISNIINIILLFTQLQLSRELYRLPTSRPRKMVFGWATGHENEKHKNGTRIKGHSLNINTSNS
jgi:hypothetical protein